MKTQEIKKFIEEQLEQLGHSKDVDIARTEGFYQGAQQALATVANVIAQSEQEEEQKKQEKQEEKANGKK